MNSVQPIPVTEVNLGAGISAFYTNRSGGVSSGSFASLNLGLNVSDDAYKVELNRKRVSMHAGKPVYFANQVHGRDVCAVGERDVAEARSLSAVPDCDGIVTADSRVAVGVYVADCVPILIAAPHDRIVAAVHAGRPGLEARVIQATLDRMIGQGADVAGIRAAVGPCICASCYEVPQEMAESFAANTQSTSSTTRWGSPGIDLRAAAERQLREYGVTEITHVSRCTYESAPDEGGYFSHRWATHHKERTEGKTGRFAGVISLNDISDR